MKILLFGKSGQLGWELNRTLSLLGPVDAFDSKQLDVGDLKALQGIIHQTKPDIIVNASAYTAVDRAEEQPELASLLNSQAPAVMAEAARANHAVFIHYSTDYVFDGTKNSAYTEKDATNPLNAYGQTKLNGEQAIGQVGGAYVILRTSWVYSLRRDSFVSKALAWSRKQDTLRIVSDQIGSPTWSRMLAEATLAMIARGLPDLSEYFSTRSGVYHLGGAGSVSRFDFVKAILRMDPQAGLQKTSRIEPARTADFPAPAIRPLVTPLDCSHFESVFGFELPHWEDALRLALQQDEAMG